MSLPLDVHKHDEVVVCLDTRNRDTNYPVTDTQNPTNDVKLPLNLGQRHLRVRDLTLATLEVPRSQELIEQTWNRLYTAGASLTQSAAVDPQFNLRVTDNTASYTFSLPDNLNTIGVAVDLTAPNVPIFTTDKPHLLGTHAAYWDWGEEISLIGGAQTLVLTSGGVLVTEVTVLSPTTFSYNVGSPDTWNANGAATEWGYLYYPPIPSPTHVAAILTAGLNAAYNAVTAATPSAFEVTYDIETSLYSVAITRATQRLNSAAIATLLASGTLEVSNVGSYGAYLGFGTTDRLFATEREPYVVTARSHPLNVTFATLSTGAYTPQTLAAEIDLACNRFYLPPAPTLVSSSLSTPINEYGLQFGDALGSVWTVNVASGLYTPVTLAQELTNNLAVVWPAGQLSVGWDLATQLFTITSLAGTVFSLEFQPESTTNLAERLGFLPVRHTAQAAYISDFAVNVPTFRDSQNNVLYADSICNVTVNEQTRTFSFGQSLPLGLPSPNTTYTVTGGASNRLTVINRSRAHGFRVGSVVDVEIADKPYRLVVLSVTSGTEFVLDLGAIVLTDDNIDVTGVGVQFTAVVGSNDQIVTLNMLHALLPLNAVIHFLDCEGVTRVGVVTAVGATTTIDFSPDSIPACSLLVAFGANVMTSAPTFHGATPPKLNLLLAPKTNSIKPVIIGFAPTDATWAAAGLLASTMAYRLEKTNYVLLEVLDMNGATDIEHIEASDNRNLILAKVVLLDDPYLHRYYPTKLRFFTHTRIGHLQLRILNPDHTLYQLHGNDWSATIRLNAT